MDRQLVRCRDGRFRVVHHHVELVDELASIAWNAGVLAA
jgi:hypothetical protein